MPPTDETQLEVNPGFRELPENVYLLGDDDHYATVKWYQDLFTGMPRITANVGDETLLTFLDEAMARTIARELGEGFAELEPMPTPFEEAREIAKAEDLAGLAIIRGPRDSEVHYVR